MNNPSVMGRKIVLDLIPNGEALLRIANTGTHVLNGYHNLDHELSVVYWSYACAINSTAIPAPVAGTEVEGSGELDDIQLKELIVNGLFHDHNHSGGMLPDVQNIARAHEILVSKYVYDLIIDWGPKFTRMHANLNCTEFTGLVFPVKPVTFAQKCARDADVMTIYSQEGRESLIGLFDELKIDLRDPEQRGNALNGNARFLRETEMFTTFGKAMKAQHLERSIEAFNEMIIGYFDTPYREFSISSHTHAMK
jgi:hypothetical protein